MPSLRILYSDPKVDVIHRPHAMPHTMWLVAGRAGTDVPSFAPGDSTDGAAEAELCHRIGDATVVRVDLVDGHATRLRMWRGGPASYELHYTIGPRGDVVVADHFRNAVALVPVADRQPSEAVTIDHFLFRHARGRDTYVASIRRVGHGEHTEIDLASGQVHTEVFDPMVSRHDQRPVAEYTADLDRALDRTMEWLRDAPGVVTMFSGGMDSTLMQSYVGDAVPTLHVAPDTADFHLGGDFVDAAAAALGIVPRRVIVRTDDFLAQLEDTVDSRGVPPHFPQWVTLRRAFETAHETFLIGERAGSYTRIGAKIPHYARRFSTPPGSIVQPVLRLAAITGRPHRLRLLAEQAPALGHDPESPDGWGVQMPQSYGDRVWAEHTFGRDAVRARFLARLAYIQERVELLPSTADRYFRHLEIAQWGDFFNENDSQFRSMAIACGKSTVDPFTSRWVMDAMLGVPPTERYEDGGRAKYIIWRLLRERVPGYPQVGKSPIAVPFRRLWEHGPLADIWREYDIPPMFTGPDRDRLRRRPGERSWNAVTWAVWQARVANNSSLSPLTPSFDQTWQTELVRAASR